jgi:cytochrome c oxidase subunit III
MSPDPRLFQPQSSSPPPPRGKLSVAQFGMRLLLASLFMVFGATIVAYLVTRTSLSHWSGKALELPTGLYGSTVLLVLLSASLEWAVAGIRQNRQRQLWRGLLLAGVLALLFLGIQGLNWWAILEQNPGINDRALALFTFYMLTGVHALHVLGGFVPLVWVLVRVSHREYSSSRYEGVRLCVQYWHFLGIVWLLLLFVIWLA